MDLSVFSRFAAARILVVGDVMLDRYVVGDSERISPEAPVPIVRVTGSNDKLGGAANVARNIAHLGAQAGLIGIVGRDDNAARLKALLDQEAIHDVLIEQDGQPTISKLRIMSRQQQLVRVDSEQMFDARYAAQLGEALERVIDDYDVVLFSDYGKGSLAHIARLIALARKNDKLVLVDPKHRDLSRYAGSNIITPNLSEFIAAGGDTSSEQTIVESARALMTTCGIESMLLTRSEKGMLVITATDTSDVPAESLEVSDVTGAGDTVVATLAVAMASGLSIHVAARLANIAAGIAVGRLGAVAVHVDELAVKLHERISNNDPASGIALETILPHIRFARRSGKKIVFTNGCFDIIHAGHVTYLQKARELGDFLIVGLNTDASVGRLKGAGRPIHSYAQRATVLGGLESVDWVLPFGDAGDDTPLELIKAVNPDVLVKGGDYTPETIVGAPEVIASGGTVEVIDLVPGVSTSNIVDKL